MDCFSCKCDGNTVVMVMCCSGYCGVVIVTVLFIVYSYTTINKGRTVTLRLY